MAIPTYDGLALFGSLCTAHTVDRLRSSDTGPYFGEDGLPSLDGGGRGRSTLVVGTLTGLGPEGLAVAFGALRSFHDGVPRVFTDSLGAVWPEVLMGPVEPLGRVRQSPRGGFLRGFRVVLTHLR